MELVENGCPICHEDVRGDPANKYLCKKCNILYDEHNIVRGQKPIEKPIEKPVEQPVELEVPKIKSLGIQREKGYLYFIDKKGDVARVKRAKSRADKGPKLHETVAVVGLKKEKGWLYYLDSDGDIARSEMARKNRTNLKTEKLSKGKNYRE